jgi:hypothetical protein
MIQTNKAMANLIAKNAEAPILAPSLAALLKQEFRIQGDYVFIDKLFSERKLPTTSLVEDETGVEVFVNSFHTDDYIDSRHLPQALAFTVAVRRVWNNKFRAKHTFQLAIVLSVTEFGVNFKLHKVRPLQPYLADDLESYAEPIFLQKFPD